jgi:hypothetical protein
MNWNYRPNVVLFWQRLLLSCSRSSAAFLPTPFLFALFPAIQLLPNFETNLFRHTNTTNNNLKLPASATRSYCSYRLNFRRCYVMLTSINKSFELFSHYLILSFFALFLHCIYCINILSKSKMGYHSNHKCLHELIVD